MKTRRTTMRDEMPKILIVIGIMAVIALTVFWIITPSYSMIIEPPAHTPMYIL